MTTGKLLLVASRSTIMISLFRETDYKLCYDSKPCGLEAISMYHY
jgi:hypothetical protein